MDLVAIIWLALLILFLVVEAACPLHLVSVWFAAGSLVAAVIAWLGGGLWLQIALFLAVSGALLACLWPFTKKFLNPRRSATNVDAVIGTEGYITEAVDNLEAVGQVKLGGMYWTARSENGKNIEATIELKQGRTHGYNPDHGQISTLNGPMVGVAGWFIRDGILSVAGTGVLDTSMPEVCEWNEQISEVKEIRIGGAFTRIEEGVFELENNYFLAI